MADTQQPGSSTSQGNAPKPVSGQNNPKQLSWGQPQSTGTGRGAATPGSSSPVSKDQAPSSRLIGTFVAGLIVGLLIAWAWFDLRSTDASKPSAMSTSSSEFTITQTTAENTSAPSEATSQAGAATSAQGATSDTSHGTTMAGAAITVPGSQSAGWSVEVTSITSSSPVWAVVYSKADRTGQVMGAARFAARKSGTIELVHMTQTGHTYYVGLVADTAAHTYVPRINLPILGSDGTQVMSQFTAK